MVLMVLFREACMHACYCLEVILWQHSKLVALASVIIRSNMQSAALLQL